MRMICAFGNVDTGRVTTVFKGHTDHIWGIAFSPGRHPGGLGQWDESYLGL